MLSPTCSLIYGNAKGVHILNGYIENNSHIGETPFSSMSVFRDASSSPASMLTIAQTWHNAIEAISDSSLDITNKHTSASFFSASPRSETLTGSASVFVVFRKTVNERPSFRCVLVDTTTASNVASAVIGKYTEIYGQSPVANDTRVISALIKYFT